MHGFSHNPAVSSARGISAHHARLLLAVSLLLFPLSLQAETVPLPHPSVDRSGELRVSNGMTLHINADLGSVRIETLPPNAPPVLRYNVHIETEVAEPLAQRLLEKYSLTTRETLDSVFLTGALPNTSNPAANRMHTARNVQFWVQFVVSVPATFSLDVSTGAGDIDMALSKNSAYLYVSIISSHSIQGYRVHQDGSLSWVSTITGVPVGADELASN